MGIEIKRRKLPHWTFEGATYFVTFRTREGELASEEVSLVLQHILSGDSLFYRLFAAVVMPDHVHLLLRPNDGVELSRIMKGIKGVSARKVHLFRQTGMSGPPGKESGPPEKKSGPPGEKSGPPGTTMGPPGKMMGSPGKAVDSPSHSALWQDESFDRMVRDQAEYEEKLKYIYHNPVKRGLTQDPATYPGWYGGAGIPACRGR